ncbi:hypothetical protein RB195_011464 [Necator americanus]|uniref:Reverse transcriptase domain-containing protein n=1 Tax=Necator americanus TaxID=51031 RepID=A0ABR1D2I1_NECAM
MRKLARDDMEMKTDGWQLHHLRFADDIVLTTSSISQAERLLTDFDETCGCIDAPFTLDGTNISERTSYDYLRRGIEDVVEKTRNILLRPSLNHHRSPALTFENGAPRKKKKMQRTPDSILRKQPKTGDVTAPVKEINIRAAEGLRYFKTRLFTGTDRTVGWETFISYVSEKSFVLL